MPPPPKKTQQHDSSSRSLTQQKRPRDHLLFWQDSFSRVLLLFCVVSQTTNGQHSHVRIPTWKRCVHTNEMDLKNQAKRDRMGALAPGQVEPIEGRSCSRARFGFFVFFFRAGLGKFCSFLQGSAAPLSAPQYSSLCFSDTSCFKWNNTAVFPIVR